MAKDLVEHAEPVAPETVPELGYFTTPVAALERGKAFYGGVIGRRFEPGESYAHIGNTRLPGGLHAGAGSTPKVWFRVAEIQAAVARVRALGGQADEPQEGASGWSADCRDDQGARFSLWQPAPGYA